MRRKKRTVEVDLRLIEAVVIGILAAYLYTQQPPAVQETIKIYGAFVVLSIAIFYALTIALAVVDAFGLVWWSNMKRDD